MRYKFVPMYKLYTSSTCLCVLVHGELLSVSLTGSDSNDAQDWSEELSTLRFEIL